MFPSIFLRIPPGPAARSAPGVFCLEKIHRGHNCGRGFRIIECTEEVPVPGTWWSSPCRSAGSDLSHHPDTRCIVRKFTDNRVDAVRVEVSSSMSSVQVKLLRRPCQVSPTILICILYSDGAADSCASQSSCVPNNLQACEPYGSYKADRTPRNFFGDFGKALDKIPHGGLLGKLWALGVIGCHGQRLS